MSETRTPAQRMEESTRRFVELYRANIEAFLDSENRMGETWRRFLRRILFNLFDRPYEFDPEKPTGVSGWWPELVAALQHHQIEYNWVLEYLFKREG